MRRIACLRCNTAMQFLRREKIQLGQTGAFLGDWPNIVAGALDAMIYYCPRCGKIEFFMPNMEPETYEEPSDLDIPPDADTDIVGVSMDGIPQVRCPRCGKKHDFDYPKCPYCGMQS